MSYISDFLASEGTEEDYLTFRNAAARENRIERESIKDWEGYAYENADLDLEIDYEDEDEDEYPLGRNDWQE